MSAASVAATPASALSSASVSSSVLASFASASSSAASAVVASAAASAASRGRTFQRMKMPAGTMIADIHWAPVSPATRSSFTRSPSDRKRHTP